VRQRDRDGRQTGDYYFEVRYQYDFSGHRYTSDRYGLKAPAFQDYSKAGRLTDLYRAESRAVCFVNPSAPNEAVLRRGSLFMPLLVLFPMVFVAIGVLGIYSMWRPQLATGDKQKAISDRAVRPPGRTIGVCFFMIIGRQRMLLRLLRPAIIQNVECPAMALGAMRGDFERGSSSQRGSRQHLQCEYFI